MATPSPPATPARATRWTRLEQDERRRQILACARRLFSERHYGAVSAAEIAREAGVTRGLVHHYFGTKRDLYLEVVRSLFRLPDEFFAVAGTDRAPADAFGEVVDRWLEVVARNRQTLLAIAGAPGFGRDPEIEAILDEARERIADGVISLLRAGERGDPSTELRALVLAYAGFVEAATLDWLRSPRLTEPQLRELLLHGLLELHRRVLPRVEAVR